MMRPPIALAARPLRAGLIRPPPLRLRRCQSSSSTPKKTEATGATAPSTTTKSEREDPIPVPNTVSPLPIWQRLGPLTTVATSYARAQKRRPWATQFVSALVIYCAADLSAQSIGGDDAYDPERTARSLVIGGIAAIPSYSWFVFLSHSFNYASRILSLGTKIIVNQIVFAPTFNTYFFGSQALLSGSSPSEVVDRIVTAVPTSVVSSCRFWPIVTAFSFTFVPIEYRSVFSGVIAIGWQTYLALLNRRAEVKEARLSIDTATETDGAV